MITEIRQISFIFYFKKKMKLDISYRISISAFKRPAWLNPAIFSLAGNQDNIFITINPAALQIAGLRQAFILNKGRKRPGNEIPGLNACQLFLINT